MRWMTVVLAMASVGTAGAQQAAQTTRSLHLQDAQAAVAQAPEAEKGAAWLRLAVRYQDAAQYAEAEHAYRQALAQLKHASLAVQATALDQLGTLYVETGRAAKAEPLERRALALRLEAQDRTAIGVSYTHLAALAFGKGDLAGAETNAQMAVSLLAPSDAAAPENATPEQQMAALLNLSLRSPIPIYGTVWLIGIAYLIRYMPYGMRYSYNGVLQIHKELEEAGVASGAGIWQVLGRVIAPLLSPALVAAWLFIFLISSRELSIAILLAGPNSQVIAVSMFDLWQNGQAGELSALGLLWTLLMVLVASAFYFLERRQSAKTFG